MKLESLLRFTKLRENHRRLAWFLINNRHYMNPNVNLDRFSWRIIKDVRDDDKLETLILASTLLRYSDCVNLDFDQLFSGSDQIITQNKTKNSIKVKWISSIPPWHDVSDIRKVYPFFFSWEKTRYAINKATPIGIKKIMRGHNSATHIFRYLRSVDLQIKGKDSTFIQQILGHSSDEAQKFYLLSELKAYFLNNP